MSHDLNGDPEVWELTERFGDRALRVWLEILSITDKTEGLLRGPRQQMVDLLRRRGRVTASTCRAILQYAVEKRWLVDQSTAALPSDAYIVRNYGEFHRTKEHKKSLKETQEAPLLPSLPSELPKQTLAHRSMRENGFSVFWQAYPRKKSKGRAEGAWAKLRPDEQLQGTILSALERAKTADWSECEMKHIPYPASWLNAKGWLDEIPGSTSVAANVPEARTCKACGEVHLWKQGQRTEPCPAEPI